ncbi:creatininase family protein [Paraburkholderia sp. JHI2823]|uniref:creatininase family protein n=2 Tax=Paraburkholderia TaxID=1822464 RepID=UPI00042387E2|nr:creatininase family protein [Paraburkholderia mimosarum]
MKLMVRQAAAAAVFFALGHAAFAQAPATVELENLTWTELRDQIHAGKTTIIIPIGGTEQSGPYVALGKHNVRVKVLSERVAQGLGNAIVAPVIAYVPEGSYAPPTSHMRFPGTITVTDDVFEKTLMSAANSFKIHGFKNIVFLGDHGGYEKDIRHVVAQLNSAWAGSGARAFVPSEYYGTSSDGYAQILRQHGVPDNEIGTHAGLADTSLLLAVAPQMVRSESLRNAPQPGAADGVYGGDPRHSSVELGKLGTDAIVSRTIESIRKETGVH